MIAFGESIPLSGSMPSIVVLQLRTGTLEVGVGRGVHLLFGGALVGVCADGPAWGGVLTLDARSWYRTVIGITCIRLA